MLPINPFILSQADLIQLCKGAFSKKESQEFRFDPESVGLVWEIELGEVDDLRKKEIEKAGLWFFGGEKTKKVVILGIPEMGSEKDVLDLSWGVTRYLNGVFLEKIIIDTHLSREKCNKFGATLPFLENYFQRDVEMKMAFGMPIEDQDIIPLFQIQMKKNSQQLVDFVMSHPVEKERFLKLGQSIYLRVKEKADQYAFEAPDAIGFLNEEHTLAEFFKEIDLSQLKSEQEKVQFFLKLFNILERCYLSQTGHSTAFKRSFIEGLLFQKESLEKVYGQQEKLVSILYERVQSFKQEEVVPSCSSSSTSPQWTNQEQPHVSVGLSQWLEEAQQKVDQEEGLKREISVIETCPLSAETVRLELEKMTLEGNSIEKLTHIFGRMNRMVMNEDEADLVAEMGRFQKAWKLGDVKALSQLTTERAKEKELEATATTLEKAIQEKKSTLCVCSIPAFLGKDNLIERLKKKGISIVQVVAKEPSLQAIQGIFYRIFPANETKPIGSLLGTVHMASRQMMELNRAIHHDLQASQAIYLEVAPKQADDLTHSISGLFSFIFDPVLPLLMTEAQRKKLELFLNRSLPVLLEMLKENGASAAVIVRLQEGFAQMPLNHRYKIFQKMISEVSQHLAEMVFVDDFFSQTPIGIDHILAVHALHYKKPLNGLEKDDEERKKLVSNLYSPQPITSGEIDQLPTEELEISSYLQKKVSGLTKLFENWKSGNQEVFLEIKKKGMESDPDLYNALLTKRDVGIAENIDQALKKGPNPAFFGIGTAHIDGVVKRLQERGYRLEQVRV